MTEFADIPLSDAAEKLAQEYFLSTVLIIIVSRDEKGTRTNWASAGSSFEALGAAQAYIHDFLHEVKNEEEATK